MAKFQSISQRASHRQYAIIMKKTLFIFGVISLFSTTGCIFPEGGGGGRGHDRDHDHARYEHHDEVVAGPPVLVVRPPEVIVR